MKQASKYLALALISAISLHSGSLLSDEVKDARTELLRVQAPENDQDPLQDWIADLTRPHFDQATDLRLSCRDAQTLEAQITASDLSCEAIKKVNMKSGFVIQCPNPQTIVLSSPNTLAAPLCRSGQVQNESISNLQLPAGFGLYIESKPGTGEVLRLSPNPKKKTLGLGLKILVFDKGPDFDVAVADLESVKANVGGDAAFRLVASPQKFGGQDLNLDKRLVWAQAALNFLDAQAPPKWALLGASNFLRGGKADAVSSVIGRDVLLRFTPPTKQTTLTKSLCKEFDSWIVAKQLLASDQTTPLPQRTLDFDCQLVSISKPLSGPTIQLTRTPLPLKVTTSATLPFRTKEDMRSPTVLQALVKPE